MSIQKFWKLIYNNKTKITGAALVALGSLQANSEAMRAIMTPEQFAWFTVLAGVFVALLGFINSNKPTI